MQANVNAAQKTKYKRAAQVKEKEKQQHDDDDDDEEVKNNVSLTKLKQEFTVVTVIISFYTVVLKSLPPPL